MTDNHAPQSLLDKLSAQAKMRPKWVFVLEHVGLGVAIILVAIGLVYLGSFLWYLWRAAQFASLTAIGVEGYQALFQYFPWWHLLFVLAGFIGLFYLLRKGTRIYRWPLAVTISVFALAFIVAASLANVSKLHQAIANREMEGHPLPIIGFFHHAERGKIYGLITPGVITQVGRNQFLLRSGGQSLTVEIYHTTQLPSDWRPAKGDQVVVIGEREEDRIEAVAIHTVDELPDRPPFQIQSSPETIPLPPSYY